MTSTGTIAATIRSVLAELPTDMLRSAKNVSAESAERIRCATTGTSHDAPQAALDSIADSIGHIEEALDALDQVARRLDDYLSILDLGDRTTTSMSAGSTEPRKMVGPAAKGPINPPNKRHNLNQIGRSSRPDSVNTVVLPYADVAGDLEAIRTGQATWNPTSCRYEVNRRSYGVEPNGTVFPVEGPGFVQLSRSEYQALKGVIQAGGNMDGLPPSLARNPSISSADWEKAASVYKHHKNHSGEGL